MTDDARTLASLAAQLERVTAERDELAEALRDVLTVLDSRLYADKPAAIRTYARTALDGLDAEKPERPFPLLGRLMA